MSDRCIHGFEPQHCAACRQCVHGGAEARCRTCTPRTSREASIRLAGEPARPSQEHRGYEISYAAGQRSWAVQAPEDGRSVSELFGSAFQARRAIDALLDRPKSSSRASKAG